jgi:hypothetical protein
MSLGKLISKELTEIFKEGYSKVFLIVSDENSFDISVAECKSKGELNNFLLHNSCRLDELWGRIYALQCKARKELANETIK